MYPQTDASNWMHRSNWTQAPLQNMDHNVEFMNNSRARESPEMKRIRSAVKEAGIFVVLGYSEREGSILSNATSKLVQANDNMIVIFCSLSSTQTEMSFFIAVKQSQHTLNAPYLERVTPNF